MLTPIAILDGFDRPSAELFPTLMILLLLLLLVLPPLVAVWVAGAAVTSIELEKSLIRCDGR